MFIYLCLINLRASLMQHYYADLSEQPSPMQLSIIVPMYNEANNLLELFTRLKETLNQMAMTYEIICINDGSKDNTLKKILESSTQDSHVKVIDLSRNFGKEVALSAGIDYSQGLAVIPIDSDLQDPPELIAQLVAKWQEGFDVVYATRISRRGESWLKSFTAKLFYQIASRIGEVYIPQNTGDFRLLDRKVVEALKRLPERSRFMKGLFAWVGFRQTSVYFDRQPRHKGITSWDYWKLWNFALDGITSFSTLPLKLWTYIGFGISSFAFVYAAILILRTVIVGIDVPGYASLMVVTLFLGGINLLVLGVIGEYLSRIFTEVKQRPLYLVRGIYGFEEDKTAKTKQFIDSLSAEKKLIS